MDISRAEAGKMAEGARTALLQRIYNGGEDMPPFRYLNGEEVRSLIAYLKQLAGIARAEGEQIAIKESPLRVGEHIAKSTCHICHNASGTNPGVLQLSEGAIPPLNTLTSRLSRLEFIRKVTRGAPVVMGAPPLRYRGRMPVFYYLSEAEADDVYSYLTLYPPYQWATLDSVNPELAENRPTGNATPPQKGSMRSDATPSNARRPDETPNEQIRASVVAGLSVALLVAILFGFTVRELMKLSAAAEVRHSGPCNIEIEQAGDVADAESESRLIA
jgi:mono/diheme cytochrome c family protein